MQFFVEKLVELAHAGKHRFPLLARQGFCDRTHHMPVKIAVGGHDPRALVREHNMDDAAVGRAALFLHEPFAAELVDGRRDAGQADALARGKAADRARLPLLRNGLHQMHFPDRDLMLGGRAKHLLLQAVDRTVRLHQ